MRILLTGGRGFIGKNLHQELITHGHRVIVTDIEEGDLRNPGVAALLIGRERPDVVVHLAAQVGRLNGEDNWRHTIESNVIMTTLVANAAADVGARLVYTSTSEVYGDQGDNDCYEDGPLVLPHNLYGLSKRWGEEACQLYCPDGLQIIRPSMPYGPGAPPGRGRRAMDNMLWQANHRKPIIVHRGAKRSWCWIGDVCRAWRMVIEDGGPGAYNIGRDDDEIEMEEVARMACAMAGAHPSLIDLVDPPARQTVVKRLVTTKIESLGWQAMVELEEGMTKLWGWIKRYDEHGRFDSEVDSDEYDRRAMLAA